MYQPLREYPEKLEKMNLKPIFTFWISQGDYWVT